MMGGKVFFPRGRELGDQENKNICYCVPLLSSSLTSPSSSFSLFFFLSSSSSFLLISPPLPPSYSSSSSSFLLLLPFIFLLIAPPRLPPSSPSFPPSSSSPSSFSSYFSFFSSFFLSFSLYSATLSWGIFGSFQIHTSSDWGTPWCQRLKNALSHTKLQIFELQVFVPLHDINYSMLGNNKKKHWMLWLSF